MARYELCKRFRPNETRPLSREHGHVDVARQQQTSQTRSVLLSAYTVWTWYVFSLKCHYF
jgi:hypothetical protein